MDRKNRWDAADSKLTKSFRKVEKRYFRKHIKNKVISGTFIFLLGIGLILAVSLYIEPDIDLIKPVYLVVTDPEAFYEQADIYPLPFKERNPLDDPETVELFFHK